MRRILFATPGHSWWQYLPGLVDSWAGRIGGGVFASEPILGAGDGTADALKDRGDTGIGLGRHVRLIERSTAVGRVLGGAQRSQVLAVAHHEARYCSRASRASTDRLTPSAAALASAAGQAVQRLVVRHRDDLQLDTAIVGSDVNQHVVDDDRGNRLHDRQDVRLADFVPAI